MSFINVEIKAACKDPSFFRNYLLSHGAMFKGLDTQTDTYFDVKRGRLKLREGNIENNLIYYERENIPGAKNSNFSLLKVDDAKLLKEVLTKTIGVKVIVIKNREIYYINNVKFHIDEVPGLGCFVEIEAGNIKADFSSAELRDQCEYYIKELKIKQEDLVDLSYCDLLMKVNGVT